MLVFLFSSCNNQHDQEGDKAIARVKGQYLYLADIKDRIPENMNPNDSAKFVSHLIDDWVKNQLLYEKAILNLDDQDKKLEKQVKEFRKTLFIHAYKQLLIEQKADTIIYDREMEEYYYDYLNEFTLQEPIIKGLFIKYEKQAPKSSEIKDWFYSNDSKDIEKLDGYCYQYANKYDYFNDDWVSFHLIRKNLPNPELYDERFLRRNQSIEAEDSNFYYFVKINDYKFANDTAPLSYVSKQIKTILLNKKKIQVIKQLESSLLEQAYQKKKIEKY